MPEKKTMKVFDTNTNAAYKCPYCGGHNCEFEDCQDPAVDGEGYFDGSQFHGTWFCHDCGKPYGVTFELKVVDTHTYD